ncbi:hypothetical protein Mapa_012532 [Marchantia paleacea]|nr:hypothetical protein Mapa_012532 [Marchantia paleacea]
MAYLARRRAWATKALSGDLRLSTTLRCRSKPCAHPWVVSCADILALAARRHRGDGRRSKLERPSRSTRGCAILASEANTDLPPPFSDYNTLVIMFAKKGLNARDMVVLSGSHTVGKANCAVMQSRLYNFTSVVATDPFLLRH